MKKLKIDQKLNQNTTRKRKNTKISFSRLFSLIAVLIFVVALCVYGVNAAVKKGNDIKSLFGKNIIENQQTISIDTPSTETTSSLLKKIGEHIVLPDEEEVTFAKVKDPKALQDQSSFYKGIEKGDYIVLYPSLAVIYNLQKDIIVNTVALK